jgi:F420-non-reducing hydrogenase small subunit
MAEKPTVAIGLLSGCFGCLMSFLDLADDLVDLLDRVELRRTPFNDVKELEEVDIGILEGAVATDENLALAQLMRGKSKVLVSLGACSTLGGIPGLRNFQAVDRVIEGIYGNKVPDDEDLPKLLPKVIPVPQVVKVDIEVRGCPPTSSAIKAVLMGVLDETVPDPPGKNLCVECPRTKNAILTPQRGFLAEGVRSVMELETIDPHICLVEQGVLCMGIATVAGCNARCPQNNIPCRGCNGPVPGVESQGNKLIDTVASLLPPGALMFFEDCVGTGYRYTAAYDENLKVERK